MNNILTCACFVSHSIPGWTGPLAEKFCSGLLRGSASASACRILPGMDLSERISVCRSDLLHSGDTRVAGIHLNAWKRQCRETLFRNASLWEREEVGRSYHVPPRDIADTLCVNDCSGNGICDRGK